MKIHTILKSTRWPFLVLAPACLFLGWSVAIANDTEFNVHLLLLSLLGAVLAHISVNTLNEYSDFKSGLDLNTAKTAFSGGSGALPENPEMARAVFFTGLISLLAFIAIGLYLSITCGWMIIPVGIVGIFLILFYTEWINKHPILCLLAPGLGFGILMVTGAHYVLTGEYSLIVGVVSLVPFFVVNNLLLLNQYPDINADRDAGRRHLPIAYGIELSNGVYCFFLLMTLVVIVSMVVAEKLPLMSLIALLPMPLAIFSLMGAIKYGDRLGFYPQYLGANVIVAIVTPVLLGGSIIVG